MGVEIEVNPAGVPRSAELATMYRLCLLGLMGTLISLRSCGMCPNSSLSDLEPLNLKCFPRVIAGWNLS